MAGAQGTEKVTLPFDYRTVRHANGHWERLWYKNDDDNLEGFFLDSYDDGQLHYIAYYKDGETYGPYQSWHSNGKQSYLAYYRDGKEHGQLQSWYSDGTLAYLGHYRDGQRVGTYERYTPDNMIDVRTVYQDDIKVEEEKFFYNTGQRAWLERYVNGEKHGVQINWNYDDFSLLLHSL